MCAERLDSVLPNNWKTVKLGEVCDLIKDGTHGTHKDYTDGIPLLSAKDVNYGKIFVPNDCRKISVEDFQQIHKNYSLQNNDVVLTIVGTIGRTGIVKNYNNSYTFQRSVAILRIKKTENYHYCFHYFNSSNFQLQLEQKTNSSAQGGIYLKSLSETIINLPPLPEQTRIAGCLSMWDDAIDKLKKLIEAKKKLKKGLMQRLLSSENPLAGFEGVKWKSVRLGEIGIFKTSSVDKLLHNDEIPIKLLNYMDVYKRHYIRQTDVFQDITATNKEIETFDVKKGDVFFTPSSETRGDIGHSAVALDDLNGVLYSYHLVRFRPNKNIFDIGYLGYCFRTEQIYKELQIRAQGITRYTLSIGAFNDIIALIPPLSIQQRIATILSKADEEIELLEKKLNNFETQKKGLMQILLSGRVRFKEFIN